jgi:hypothetical protein
VKACNNNTKTKMDFTQKKLTKAEWESIEKPISETEKKIVAMICRGYGDPTIRVNTHSSLFTHIKVEMSPEMEFALFQKYFQPWVAQLFAFISGNTHHSTMEKALGISKTTTTCKLRSADKIRMQHLDETIQQNRGNIFEFFMLELCHSFLDPATCYSGSVDGGSGGGRPGTRTEAGAGKSSKKSDSVKKPEMVKPESVANAAKIRPPIFYLYTLHQVRKASIDRLNSYVARFVDAVMAHGAVMHPDASTELLLHSYECIEKNPYLIRYSDRTLFSHQRDLFAIFRRNGSGSDLRHAGNVGNVEMDIQDAVDGKGEEYGHEYEHEQDSNEKTTPKLVLYIAPTGTGKTLSPIGLAEGYRVIFVCVARHVGFALAQTAISAGRKIGTAFGCDTADGIRLHNSAAREYVRNKRSGGIGKVDHSKGENVELMICDVQSYLPAMHYMLAFFKASSIVTFWDEPTITLDVELQPDWNESSAETKGDATTGISQPSIAQMIHRNWAGNRIPNVVLSCATLPREEEIMPVLADFRERFVGAEIRTITSVDCRKSISMLDSAGKVVLPHCYFSDYRELQSAVRHCEDDKTTLRYFDMREIVRFLNLLRNLSAAILRNHLEADSDDSDDEDENNEEDGDSDEDRDSENKDKDKDVGVKEPRKEAKKPVELPLAWVNEAIEMNLPLARIGMQDVKQHYLEILKRIPEEEWERINAAVKKTLTSRWSRTLGPASGSGNIGNGMGSGGSNGGAGTGIRKIQSTSQADSMNSADSPVSSGASSSGSGGAKLSKIHSVDGSLSTYSGSSHGHGVGTGGSGVVNEAFAGILLTTHDAHTLTDGPTIYLAENVRKVGQFLIQQSNISPKVFDTIQAKIKHNDEIAKQIAAKETLLEAEIAQKTQGQSSNAEEKSSKSGSGGGSGGAQGDAAQNAKSEVAERLRDEIALLQGQICNVSLDPIYIPNHPAHLQTWAPPSVANSTTAYYRSLEESMVRRIMALDIEAYIKLLLLMGIGVFQKMSENGMSEAEFQYLEIVKGLAKEQRLYLIIANSDYIYGTNYQLCHGIIGKDLILTQQKLIQSMGRVGRGDVQQEYTVRFRNDDLIGLLWKRPERNIEAENMCELFCS